MRLVIGVLILAGTALAQHPRGFARGHGPVSTYGSRHGFGNVVFPGTGRAPVTRHPFSVTDPTFAQRLGATISGWPPYTGSLGHGGRKVTYVPYVYPVYGGYVNPYQQQMPSVVVIQQPTPQPQPATPQVIINNYLDPAARPSEGITTYQAPTRAPVETAGDPSYYLIAFKDNTIYSAVAYWVEGDTLHYVTSGNVRNQVSLDLIDKETTRRLNKDRNVDVTLK
jgi:hypothetical protein